VGCLRERDRTGVKEEKGKVKDVWLPRRQLKRESGNVDMGVKAQVPSQCMTLSATFQ
jgi:hypothetical protein